MFYVNYFQYPQKVIIIINVKNLALCLNIVYIIFLIFLVVGVFSMFFGRGKEGVKEEGAKSMK